MKTPLNTWMRASDATPKRVPINCNLIALDTDGNIDDCLLTMGTKEIFKVSDMKLHKNLTHWQLLSKPETK